MNPKIAGLITQYQKDHKEDALMTLWTDFQPLVIKLMRKYYIPLDDHQDTSQEAFLTLFECANTFDIAKKVPFESYYKMTLNYWFLTRIRKKTDLVVVDHNWSAGISLSNLIESTIGNCEEIAQTNESLSTLYQALETLTPKQRQAVSLFYLQGISLKEVAKQLGCSYNVAFKHKDAGLKKMKKLF